MTFFEAQILKISDPSIRYLQRLSSLEHTTMYSLFTLLRGRCTPPSSLTTMVLSRAAKEDFRQARPSQWRPH